MKNYLILFTLFVQFNVSAQENYLDSLFFYLPIQYRESIKIQVDSTSVFKEVEFIYKNPSYNFCLKNKNMDSLIKPYTYVGACFKKNEYYISLAFYKSGQDTFRLSDNKIVVFNNPLPKLYIDSNKLTSKDYMDLPVGPGDDVAQIGVRQIVTEECYLKGVDGDQYVKEKLSENIYVGSYFKLTDNGLSNLWYSLIDFKNETVTYIYLDKDLSPNRKKVYNFDKDILELEEYKFRPE